MKAVVMLMALAGCKASPPALPSGMEWVWASADPLEWAEGRLVTAVRPPTSKDRQIHISVLLRVPQGTVLNTQLDGQGERSVKMPLGAVAARVEYWGPGDADALPTAQWRVLDVRQFEWTATGLRCVVLRPAEGRLAGLRWSCGTEADERAGHVLAQLVRSGQLDASSNEPARERAATHLAKINGCAACHRGSAPEDRSLTALVQRATDAEGLFTLRSVLRDEDPVEQYRPIDSNQGDPMMRPVCPDSELEEETGRCRDGQRARLRVDVPRGVLEGDRHVLQLCASRLRLLALLDDPGKAAWRELAAPCE